MNKTKNALLRLSVPENRLESLCYYLALSDSENLGAALGTHTLGGGLAILHLDRLRVLDLHLGAALHAVGLHLASPFLLFLRSSVAHNIVRVNRFRRVFSKNLQISSEIL